MNATLEIQKETSRVYLFDELRGLMLLSMLLYHLVYDLVAIFAVKLNWFFTPATNLWQASICCSFLFVSGACCWYSRNNYKRGLRLLVLALLFSLITWVVMPDFFIAFGLLHFLAVAVLLFPLLKKPLSQLSPQIGLILGLLLFFFTYQVSSGKLGFGSYSLALPQALYRTSFLFPLGFCRPDFASSDYFPLFPYLFLFLAGTFVGRMKLPDFAYKTHCHWLAWIGRKSLWVYLLHQPVLLALLWLIFQLI